MEPLVLSFDVGTQSTRASLINKQGQIVLISQVKYTSPYMPTDQFGKAEQYPDFYYDNICKASILLKEKDVRNEYFPQIKAVVIACIRDTVLILDKENKPLSNIIVWMDNRRASGHASAKLWQKLLFAVAGKTEMVNMIYRDAFFNWIRENDTQNYQKAAKFVLLPGWVNYRLTGTLKDGVANQVGHVPFDNKNRCWMKKGISRCVVDVPYNMLIDLVESGEVIGTITKETASKSAIPEGLPLIASGTDKACEALGLSVSGEGRAAISLGTAASVQFCSKHYFEPEPFMPPWPSVIPGRFNAEYQIYRGYWTVSWFIEQFCQNEVKEAERLGVSAEELIDEWLDEVPAGCNGLIMTPHLAPGTTNPFAKAVITGLSDRHTKKHLYRAIIEGIDFELYRAMKNMERRSGQIIHEIHIAGGGSKCDRILQITADIFGLPVKRSQTHEATSVGSAIPAFVGLGEFPDYDSAVESMSHSGDVFTPNMENHGIYMDIFHNVYKKIEKTNEPIFRKIKHLVKR